jgi:MoaA/NifB/PqqE/SkfB family radical SAM enzyme
MGKGLRRYLSYKRLVEVSSELNFPLAPPLISFIQITMRCNSRCSYCDIWKLKEHEMPSIDTLEEIFSSLRDLGVKIVSLTGGEPLTRNDLPDIIQLARHRNLQTHVCTNGIYLTKERAVELAEAGVSSIILSLDTLDPKIYERHRGVPFKFAERALDALSFIAEKYSSVFCAVNCVITKYNIGNIASFVEKVCERGRGKISVNLQPYHLPASFLKISREWGLKPEMVNKLLNRHRSTAKNDLNPSPELKPIFEAEIKRLIRLKKSFPLSNSVLYIKSIPEFLFDNKLPSNFSCLFGYMGFVIRYDLRVSPCWRLPPIGDLQKEKLSKIWFSKRYSKVRRRMRNLECPKCLLPCHNEPGWFTYYNFVYKCSL